MGGAVPRPLIGGGSSKFDGGALSQYMGKAWGGALNAVEKMGALVLMGGVSKKIVGCPPSSLPPPLWETLYLPGGS